MTARPNRIPILIAALSVIAGSPSLAGAQAQTIIRQAPSDVAATVDGHVIPMSEVERLCLRNGREGVVDQMIQNYVIDRECKTRGITIADTAIDAQVADLRKQYAPASLEDTLTAHGWSMADLREQLRHKSERAALVAAAMTPIKMVHCREILIKAKSPGADGEALASITAVTQQLRQGKTFAALAARYPDAASPERHGDIGILYENMLGSVDPAVLTEALALPDGGISKMPVKTADGYCLVQVVSMSKRHSPAEDGLYQDADVAAKKVQAMFLEPRLIGDLIHKSTITYAAAEVLDSSPLLENAVVIDGHPILMKDVLAKCVADGGSEAVDNLVQNYVVDRECERRGIAVNEAEVDEAVAELRRRIAPHTVEEGLPAHHTTMAGLRRDFRQQIERTKLAVDQVKPVAMAHCRIITIPYTAGNSPGPVAFPASARNVSAPVASPSAMAAIAAVREQLQAGKDFADLARERSEAGGGDAGVVYPGMRNMDTAVLNAVLAMKSGQITSQPIKSYGGYAFIQVVSTSDNHASGEDAIYGDALKAYRDLQAQPLILPIVQELVKKAKVAYNLPRPTLP